QPEGIVVTDGADAVERRVRGARPPPRRPAEARAGGRDRCGDEAEFDATRRGAEGELGPDVELGEDEGRGAEGVEGGPDGGGAVPGQVVGDIRGEAPGQALGGG